MANEREMRLHRCCFCGNGAAQDERIRTEIENALQCGFTTYVTGVDSEFELRAGLTAVSARAEHPEMRIICAVSSPDAAQTLPPELKGAYVELMLRSNFTKVISPAGTPDASEICRGWMRAHSARMVTETDNVSIPQD